VSSRQSRRPWLAQTIENVAPRSQLVSLSPSQESTVQTEEVSEHGLVQSKGGESAPGEHAPADPRSAAQSSVSVTPLGHMIAPPSVQVAEASGSQTAPSLSGLHAIHRGGTVERGGVEG
jgi:hypothetical protein